MKKYHVGIVGYGWAAGAPITAINSGPLGQVSAVCSTRNLDPRELSARHASEGSRFDNKFHSPLRDSHSRHSWNQRSFPLVAARAPHLGRPVKLEELCGR